MDATKVIIVDEGSLGFEIGSNPKWRGEFTLEQVAEFGIKAGTHIKVEMLEMEDTFATVEFGEDERTTVPITKIPQNNEMFSPETKDETKLSETLRGK